MEAKTIYVEDIKEKTQVEDIFLVRTKNQGMTKSGSPYIALILGDKTGEVKARIWDNAAKLGSQFDQGDIVKIKSWAILYQGVLQLNVTSIAKHTCSDLELHAFLPASKNDINQCFQELVAFIEQVKEKNLKQLLTIIFDDASLMEAFKKAPAAKSLHHVYIGGLLEHTLQVTRLACDISKYYKNLNNDLLIAGAMLHDIGKIRELAYQDNFTYTDSGRLIGHITLGVELLNEKIQLIPEFPQDLAMILKHLILSHHGEYAFGSPKRPKTLEAFMLNYLDDLDSKMEGIKQLILQEKRSSSKWTAYNKLYDRYLYKETFVEDDMSDSDEATRE